MEAEVNIRCLLDRPTSQMRPLGDPDYLPADQHRQHRAPLDDPGAVAPSIARGQRVLGSCPTPGVVAFDQRLPECDVVTFSGQHGRVAFYKRLPHSRFWRDNVSREREDLIFGEGCAREASYDVETHGYKHNFDIAPPQPVEGEQAPVTPRGRKAPPVVVKLILNNDAQSNINSATRRTRDGVPRALNMVSKKGTTNRDVSSFCTIPKELSHANKKESHPSTLAWNQQIENSDEDETESFAAISENMDWSSLMDASTSVSNRFERRKNMQVDEGSLSGTDRSASKMSYAQNELQSCWDVLKNEGGHAVRNHNSTAGKASYTSSQTHFAESTSTEVSDSENGSLLGDLRKCAQLFKEGGADGSNDIWKYSPEPESTVTETSEGCNKFEPLDARECDWYYHGLRGEVNGPFSMEKLRDWNTEGQFPIHFDVWKSRDYKPGNSMSLTMALARCFRPQDVDWTGVHQKLENPTAKGFSSTSMVLETPRYQDIGDSIEKLLQYELTQARKSPDMLTPKTQPDDSDIVDECIQYAMKMQRLRESACDAGKISPDVSDSSNSYLNPKAGKSMEGMNITTSDDTAKGMERSGGNEINVEAFDLDLRCTEGPIVRQIVHGSLMPDMAGRTITQVVRRDEGEIIVMKCFTLSPGAETKIENTQSSLIRPSFRRNGADVQQDTNHKSRLADSSSDPRIIDVKEERESSSSPVEAPNELEQAASKWKRMASADLEARFPAPEEDDHAASRIIANETLVLQLPQTINDVERDLPGRKESEFAYPFAVKREIQNSDPNKIITPDRLQTVILRGADNSRVILKQLTECKTEPLCERTDPAVRARRSVTNPEANPEDLSPLTPKTSSDTAKRPSQNSPTSAGDATNQTLDDGIIQAVATSTQKQLQHTYQSQEQRLEKPIGCLDEKIKEGHMVELEQRSATGVSHSKGKEEDLGAITERIMDRQQASPTVYKPSKLGKQHEDRSTPSEDERYEHRFLEKRSEVAISRMQQGGRSSYSSHIEMSVSTQTMDMIEEEGEEVSYMAACQFSGPPSSFSGRLQTTFSSLSSSSLFSTTVQTATSSASPSLFSSKLRIFSSNRSPCSVNAPSLPASSSCLQSCSSCTSPSSLPPRLQASSTSRSPSPHSASSQVLPNISPPSLTFPTLSQTSPTSRSSSPCSNTSLQTSRSSRSPSPCSNGSSQIPSNRSLQTFLSTRSRSPGRSPSPGSNRSLQAPSSNSARLQTHSDDPASILQTSKGRRRSPSSSSADILPTSSSNGVKLQTSPSCASPSSLSHKASSNNSPELHMSPSRKYPPSAGLKLQTSSKKSASLQTSPSLPSPSSSSNELQTSSRINNRLQTTPSSKSLPSSSNRLQMSPRSTSPSAASNTRSNPSSRLPSSLQNSSSNETGLQVSGSSRLQSDGLPRVTGPLRNDLGPPFAIMDSMIRSRAKDMAQTGSSGSKMGGTTIETRILERIERSMGRSHE